MTTENTAAAQTAAAAAKFPVDTIPTDPHALADYLAKLDVGEQVRIADRLSGQLGGTPDAIDRAVSLVGDALRTLAAGDQQAPGLIPTEPLALYEFLLKLPPSAQTEVAGLLAAQLGGTPHAIDRASNLVDNALQLIAHEEEIIRERANLAQAIEDGLAAVRAADAALTALRSNAVYDVEYAEGGQRVLDLRVFLDDAARNLRAAAVFNPCPPNPTGADR